MRRLWAPGLAVLSFLLMSVPARANDSAYRREIEGWQKDREERLRKPDSWLTLVGLTWLEEGESTCGSDPGSDVVLPDSAPARAGVFHLRSGKTEFRAAPGAGISHEGEPVEHLALSSDMEGSPTELELGSIVFYLIERDGRIGVRIKDSRNPTYVDFQGLEFYPVSAGWRHQARFIPYDPPRTIQVPSVLGTVNERLSPGAVVFEVSGRAHRLEALEGGPGELFLIFSDVTNGGETYGGGRFLYATYQGERAVVDFNKAYNPPCVFSAYATCPLPPNQNRLPISIQAGEKVYADGVH